MPESRDPTMRSSMVIGAVLVALMISCSEDPSDNEDEDTGTGVGGRVETGTGASGGAFDPGAGGDSTMAGGAGGGEGGAVNTGGGPPGAGGDRTGGGGDNASTGGSASTGGDPGTEPPSCGEGPAELDLPPLEDYTETIGGVSIEMVYVPGGTFTLGCAGSACDADTSPVEGVTVSGYHIMKIQMTSEMREAATGESSSGFDSGTWYDCMAFACELGKQTGKAYRMMTEAEFEYAAKNHLGQLSEIDGSEEWAYNSWSTSHSTETQDPVGAAPGSHTQKTRRDKATGDNITGRLIRSIDGIGPHCRLTVSAEMEYPPGYVPSCETCPPSLDGEPVNSYRDPRWITGSDAHWTTGTTAIGNFDLRVWEDGTASYGGQDGQWFTSNNLAFVFVPTSGSSTQLSYIFLDETQGSVISDKGFMNGGFIGRFQKVEASGTKPTVPGILSGAELAAAAGDEYKMVDMVNLPESEKEQDPRLIDGPDQGWFQNNISAGGTHNYRKDVDADEFRFVVIDGGSATMLANGSWFTVNNTLLRITHSGGYTTDYLYAVDPNGTFYHNSFQEYERGDFRMFEIYSNASGDFPATCIESSCSEEIAKGQAASIYATIDGGESTYLPAPCPAEGCE